MKKLKNGEYEVETAGLGERFTFDPGPSRCGGIMSGVVFEVGRGGGWVVPLAELEEMLRVAHEVRGLPNNSLELTPRAGESRDE